MTLWANSVVELSYRLQQANRDVQSLSYITSEKFWICLLQNTPHPLETSELGHDFNCIFDQVFLSVNQCFEDSTLSCVEFMWWWNWHWRLPVSDVRDEDMDERIILECLRQWAVMITTPHIFFLIRCEYLWQAAYKINHPFAAVLD